MKHEVQLSISYMPLPPELQAEWWEGMRKLLEILKGPPDPPVAEYSDVPPNTDELQYLGGEDGRG
jgi:hypothetical protein